MTLIDEIIQDAMRKGQFDNLPGAGERLKLDDDLLVPSEQRLAYKLLRDNGYAPDWMAEGQSLDATRDQLIRDLRRANGSQQIAALREQAAKYNRQVLNYNLKVPSGVAHKRHFNFEAELSKAG